MSIRKRQQIKSRIDIIEEYEVKSVLEYILEELNRLEGLIKK